jgi:hypothetical protein
MLPFDTGSGEIKTQALSVQMAPEHLSDMALAEAMVHDIRDILVCSKGTLIG